MRVNMMYFTWIILDSFKTTISQEHYFYVFTFINCSIHIFPLILFWPQGKINPTIVYKLLSLSLSFLFISHIYTNIRKSINNRDLIPSPKDIESNNPLPKGYIVEKLCRGCLTIEAGESSLGFWLVAGDLSGECYKLTSAYYWSNLTRTYLLVLYEIVN